MRGWEGSLIPPRTGENAWLGMPWALSPQLHVVRNMGSKEGDRLYFTCQKLFSSVSSWHCQGGEKEMGKGKGREVSGDFLKLLAHVPGQTRISSRLWSCHSNSLLYFPSAFRGQGWLNLCFVGMVGEDRILGVLRRSCNSLVASLYANAGNFMEMYVILCRFKSYWLSVTRCWQLWYLFESFSFPFEPFFFLLELKRIKYS